MMGNSLVVKCALCAALFLAVPGWSVHSANSATLEEIRERGVLRHLGVPYAHFVRPDEEGVDGLDVAMMREFARHLGVDYQWVPTTWSDALSDLTGKDIRPDTGEAFAHGEDREIRGDILANGLTILPWRKRVVRYSQPTFPTGVWLLARADSPIQPIKPSGDFATDLDRVRAILNGRSILAMENTCLDPELYGLEETGVEIRMFTESGNLGDLAPAVMNGAADATLLDIPDALVALQEWPGKIKVIGPISNPQYMGAAVRPGSSDLLDAFNHFFRDRWRDGSYRRWVNNHYPSVFLYLGDFFDGAPEKRAAQ
jgi:ABC-type amino acid transport substrate-binding protein